MYTAHKHTNVTHILRKSYVLVITQKNTGATNFGMSNMRKEPAITSLYPVAHAAATRPATRLIQVLGRGVNWFTNCKNDGCVPLDQKRVRYHSQKTNDART